jgi:hypothetical protein
MRCASFMAAVLMLAAAPVAAQNAQVPAAPAGATVVVPPNTRLLALPAPAGQWTVAQLGQVFDAADADGNGQLTRAEAQQLPYLPLSFEELDLDKDGLLSRAEYEQAPR